MINGRNTAGQFTEGNSGKPKGSRNKASIAIESLLEGQAEAFLNLWRSMPSTF
jgi:hypothetical protein